MYKQDIKFIIAPQFLYCYNANSRRKKRIHNVKDIRQLQHQNNICHISVIHIVNLVIYDFLGRNFLILIGLKLRIGLSPSLFFDSIVQLNNYKIWRYPFLDNDFVRKAKRKHSIIGRRFLISYIFLV